jgi:serine/threonine-protein kinase
VTDFDPPPADEVSPLVPTPLAAIAARAMAKRPEDRPRSARALSRELQDWLKANPQTLQSGEDDGGTDTQRWSNAMIAALLAMGVVVIGAGVWHATKSKPPAAAATEAGTGVASASLAGSGTAAQVTPAAVAASGVVLLAISPWAEVEIDGRSQGTAPPLNRLVLPAGTHTLTLRNAAFPPLTMQVQVEPNESLYIKHRFEP